MLYAKSTIQIDVWSSSYDYLRSLGRSINRPISDEQTNKYKSHTKGPKSNHIHFAAVAMRVASTKLTCLDNEKHDFSFCKCFRSGSLDLGKIMLLMHATVRHASKNAYVLAPDQP